MGKRRRRTKTVAVDNAAKSRFQPSRENPNRFSFSRFVQIKSGRGNDEEESIPPGKHVDLQGRGRVVVGRER